MEKKLLIIDDDKAYRGSLKVFLESKGYFVEIASDGIEGYEKIKSLSPDLILLDVVMPNENGISLLKKIKKEDSMNRIPIIVSSSYPGAGDLVKDMGADDFITKTSLSTEQIVSKIEQILIGK